MRKVEVHPPDPTWQNQAIAEAKQVQQALGTAVVAVHHIGSTSIPNIYAKPIIDLLVEVYAIAAVDDCAPAMVALGYQAMGEFGLPGRRYFRKDDATGTRTHHVHVFQQGSPEVVRHLVFRDFMRAHPDYAQQYSDLKRSLAAQHPTDIDRYMDGKDAFVKAMQRRALEWSALQD